MKVILSDMCTALVGMLKPEFGYFLVKRGDSFFSQRSGHGAPPDGHWRFIVLCAELAQNGLYIKDIEVSPKEIMKALREMHRGGYLWQLSYPHILHADNVLSLKSELGL